MAPESADTFILRGDISPQRSVVARSLLPRPCVGAGVCGAWRCSSEQRSPTLWPASSAELLSGNHSGFAPGKIHYRQQHMGHRSDLLWCTQPFLKENVESHIAERLGELPAHLLAEKESIVYMVSFPNHLTLTEPWPITILFTNTFIF